MIEPGWFVDFENRKQRRYHDGVEWTEHFYDPKSGPEPPAPVSDGVPPVGGADPIDAKPESLATRLLSFAILGLFGGIMFGAFLFNSVGSITPVSDVAGTVDLLEVDTNPGSSPGAASRISYVLSGTTEAGDAWRIVDEDAYRVVEDKGFPQDVVVGMGDWTDTAERVTGETWEVDHQSTNARVGWALVLAFLALLGVAGAILIAKVRSGGALAGAVFLLGYVVIGNSIGYVAVQWMQS